MPWSHVPVIHDPQVIPTNQQSLGHLKSGKKKEFLKHITTETSQEIWHICISSPKLKFWGNKSYSIEIKQTFYKASTKL